MTSRRRAANGQFAASRRHAWQGGVADPILVNRLTMVLNDVRRSLARSMDSEGADPRRDINDQCGYPKTVSELTPKHYRDMYDRESVAARVVEVLPAESWKVSPTVYEDEDADNKTQFEEAWDALAESLRGKSWYKDEEGNPVWNALFDVDVDSGIGGYGVLLLGLDDGKELSEPAEGIDDKGQQSGRPKGRKLLYLTPADESRARILRVERDKHNPRFRQPVEYEITLDSSEFGGRSTGQLTGKTEHVHWSRVIHLSDNRGVSRMQKVWNRLYDLRKIYSSDAESYWRQVVQKLFFETHPQLGGDVVVDDESLRDMMENMMNDLQHWARLTGMSVNAVAPTVVDPTPHIMVQIEGICIVIACPKRIFMGSERGELASSQDTDTWNGRLQQRQQKYLTPRVIVPFVDRLILLGVLPEPEAEEYHVKWPDLEALSEEEKANIAKIRTEAFATYVSGGVEQLILPLDYLTRTHEIPEEEAEEILEAALEEEEKREEKEAEELDQLKPQQGQGQGQFPPQQGRGVTQIPVSEQPATPQPRTRNV